MADRKMTEFAEWCTVLTFALGIPALYAANEPVLAHWGRKVLDSTKQANRFMTGIGSHLTQDSASTLGFQLFIGIAFLFVLVISVTALLRGGAAAENTALFLWLLSSIFGVLFMWALWNAGNGVLIYRIGLLFWGLYAICILANGVNYANWIGKRLTDNPPQATLLKGYQSARTWFACFAPGVGRRGVPASHIWRRGQKGQPEA